MIILCNGNPLPCPGPPSPGWHQAALHKGRSAL